MQPPGVLILTGPTASGKTALALALAIAFDAEIVGADSRQIYRGMPIGTAAPTEAERALVPHHLVGFLDPAQRYSAAQFVRDAAAAIDAIHARGKRAIVVGGTGFYIRALAGDVALAPEGDLMVRDRLAREARLHSSEFLAEWLRVLDPVRAAQIDPGDPYRLTRALEIALARRAEPADGLTDCALPALRARGVPYRKLYLHVEPQELHARIDRRTEAMLDAGLVEEAERIGARAIAANAVGYREALAFCAGWSGPSELRALLARNTRRYAKRQATWFRTEPDLVRLATRDIDAWSAAAREIRGWA